MNNIDIFLDSIDHKETLDFQLKQMENEATTLVIHLSDEFIVDSYNYLLVFKLNNNTPIVTAPLVSVDNTISTIMYNPLTYQSGYLKCEVQAYESELLVKSKTFVLEVLETIQGEPEPMPSVYPPLYNYYDYTASDFGIIDLGNFFVGTTVEDAFQEVGTKIRGVYDDLPPSPIITARTGATSPDLVTFRGGIKQYTFNTSTHEVSGASEITHRYKEGTTIEPHIHWSANGSEATAKYVKWQLEYTVSVNKNFLPAVTLTVEQEIPANSPDRYYQIAGLDPDIIGTDLKIGDYILWTLKRIPSTGTAPVNNPFGIAVGFHMEQDGLGSTTVYSK